MLLPHAGRLTTGELAARIKKITIASDPEWAARRYARQPSRWDLLSGPGDPSGGDDVTAVGWLLAAEPAAQVGVELRVGLSTLLSRDNHPGEIPGLSHRKPNASSMSRSIGKPGCSARTARPSRSGPAVGSLTAVTGARATRAGNVTSGSSTQASIDLHRSESATVWTATLDEKEVGRFDGRCGRRARTDGKCCLPGACPTACRCRAASSSASA